MGIFNRKHLLYLAILVLFCTNCAARTAPHFTALDSNVELTSIKSDVTEVGTPVVDNSKYEAAPTITNTNNSKSSSEDQDNSKPSDASAPISDTEVDELGDLQHGGDFSDIPKTINEDDVVNLPVPIDNDQQGPISEIEWIEEDEIDPDLPTLVQAMTDIRDQENSPFQGQMGIAIALFLIVVLVIGYASFIAWRRFVEARYGSREILINEEDMVDPNDMKHFSL